MKIQVECPILAPSEECFLGQACEERFSRAEDGNIILRACGACIGSTQSIIYVHESWLHLKITKSLLKHAQVWTKCLNIVASTFPKPYTYTPAHRHTLIALVGRSVAT